MFRRNTVKPTGPPSTLGSGAIPQTLRATRVMFASICRAAIALCQERGVQSITSMRRLGSGRHAPRVAPDLTVGALHAQQSLRRSGATTPGDGKKHLQRVFRSRPGARCPLAIICRPTPQCLRAYRQSNLNGPFPHLTAYACDRDGKAAATRSRAVLRCRAVHRWPCSGQRSNRSARQRCAHGVALFQQAENGYNAAGKCRQSPAGKSAPPEGPARLVELSRDRLFRCRASEAIAAHRFCFSNAS